MRRLVMVTGGRCINSTTKHSQFPLVVAFPPITEAVKVGHTYMRCTGCGVVVAYFEDSEPDD